jgi:hypothetical protein
VPYPRVLAARSLKVRGTRPVPEALNYQPKAELEGSFAKLPPTMSVRYPHLEVKLHSENPVALVAAVRLELRRAGVERDEIRRFSEQALGSESPEQARAVCSEWVKTR